MKIPRLISSGDIVLLGLVIMGLLGSIANDYVFLAAINTLLLVCWFLSVYARLHISRYLIQHLKDLDKIKAIIGAPKMVLEGDNTVFMGVWPSEELVARVSSVSAMLDKVRVNCEKAGK
jgi:hypothetical protein